MLPHRAPSVGGLIKQILAIHPELEVDAIIHIVKTCTTIQGGSGNQFGTAESIDEQRALAMARAARDRSPQANQ